MAAEQRKAKRHQQKRREKQRFKKAAALRSIQRLSSDAHPLYACLVNADWIDNGLASIMIARQVGSGRLTMAAFLVDRFAMGLKDAWGRVDVSIIDFDKTVARQREVIKTEPLNLGTAKHLVYGGIELARDLGFRLPRRYQRWTAILGPLPEGESPDMDLFLRDGKIMLCCSTRDLEARLVGTTPEKFLERSDVYYLLGSDGHTLVDDEEDRSADIASLLEDAMLERVQQWCFAHGQTPHPLLGEIVGTTLEAIMQGMPPDLEPEDDVESLAAEQRGQLIEQALSFLSASCHEDPAALQVVAGQFHAFMRSYESPDELFSSLDLGED
jgi:hypothetical protein